MVPFTRVCAMQVSKKSVREKLMSEEGAASARLSKKLVQLQDDMDLPPLRSVWARPRAAATSHTIFLDMARAAAPVAEMY